MQTSTDNPPLNTRLHNPGNTLPAVQTGTENDNMSAGSRSTVIDRLTGSIAKLGE
ncbi:hypothetical protein [Arthrobacter sp. UYCu723]